MLVTHRMQRFTIRPYRLLDQLDALCDQWLEIPLWIELTDDAVSLSCNSLGFVVGTKVGTGYSAGH